MLPDIRQNTSFRETFGRYRLIERIGQGGMAEVYHAEMVGISGFSKAVALKLIRPGLLGNHSEFIDYFVGEARLGGFLSHPNVVQTLDFGEHEGVLFLALEYVDGPDLSRVLQRHRGAGAPFPLDVALQILINVCRGLSYMHDAVDREGRSLNLVHRDLKPSNILLSRQGEVKICDFGVARSESNVTKTLFSGNIKGTARYMSPEQAWGHLKLDRRSDIFSVGLILFELVTLEPVYLANRPEALLRQAQDADISSRLQQLPEGIAREPLTQLLRWLLASEPEGRPASAGQVLESLEHVLSLIPPPHVKLDAWIVETSQRFNRGPFAEPREAVAQVAHPKEYPPNQLSMAREVASSAPDLATLPPLEDDSFQREGPIQTTDAVAGHTISDRSETADPFAEVALAEGRPRGSNEKGTLQPERQTGANSHLLARELSSNSENAYRCEDETTKPGEPSPPVPVGTTRESVVPLIGLDDTSRCAHPSAPQVASSQRDPQLVDNTDELIVSRLPVNSISGISNPAVRRTRWTYPALVALSLAGVIIASLWGRGNGKTDGALPVGHLLSKEAQTPAPPPPLSAQQPSPVPPDPIHGHLAESTPSISTPARRKSVPVSRGEHASAVEMDSPAERGSDSAEAPTQPRSAQDTETTEAAIKTDSQGTLYLSSRPSSRVYIDGVLQHEFPVQGFRTQPGPHVVVFVIEPYFKLEKRVHVEESQELRCIAYFDYKAVVCRQSDGPFQP